jgi:hypothetical protein
MLAALWGTLGAGAVFLALLAAFCQFGALLVVRPTPSISLRAVGISVGCAAAGLVLALASRHAAWYFAALSSASTGFAALYLFALLGSFPEFERRDMSIVMLSLSLWSLWVGATILLWLSPLPGIVETVDFWTRLAEWPFPK